MNKALRVKRIDSSRMRTIRSSCHLPGAVCWGGGGSVCPGVSTGGVSAWRVSTPGGVFAWGCLTGVCLPRGVSAQEECLPRGVSAGGCLPEVVCPGGICLGGICRGCLPGRAVSAQGGVWQTPALWTE